jgi:hypothetical protein
VFVVERRGGRPVRVPGSVEFDCRARPGEPVHKQPHDTTRGCAGGEPGVEVVLVQLGERKVLGVEPGDESNGLDQLVAGVLAGYLARHVPRGSIGQGGGRRAIERCRSREQRLDARGRREIGDERLENKPGYSAPEFVAIE